MSVVSPQINGVKYKIYNKNDIIQGTLLKGKQWNEEIVNILKSYIESRKLKHLLNVGSHIGSVCIPISLMIEKVSAIEAYPPTYQHLCENIQMNDIKNITTYNVAVGNSEEEVYFMGMDKNCPIEKKNRVKNNTGGMHVFTEDDIKNNVRSSNLSDKKVKNKITKLDNMEIDQFDLMLVDIEGFEWDFLQGAKEKITKNKPIIVIEIWKNEKRKKENMPTTRQQVVKYVEEMDYKMIKNINEDFIFEPL